MNTLTPPQPARRVTYSPCGPQCHRLQLHGFTWGEVLLVGAVIAGIVIASQR